MKSENIEDILKYHKSDIKQQDIFHHVVREQELIIITRSGQKEQFPIPDEETLKSRDVPKKDSKKNYKKGSGDVGSGDDGAGKEGSGNEGSGDEGAGDEGAGDVGSGGKH